MAKTALIRSNTLTFISTASKFPFILLCWRFQRRNAVTRRSSLLNRLTVVVSHTRISEAIF
jgi:hypothetical protein